ncbi:MAG: glutaredoxin family protein [Christensenellales bacterium]
MSTITLYHFEGCPACGRAKAWIKELQAEQPDLGRVGVDLVDVHKTPDFFSPVPFTYVPTFVMNGKKLLEGAVSKEKVEQILRLAL